MKIVVSRSLPKAGMDLLKNTLHEIIINPRDRNLSYNELKDFVKPASAQKGKSQNKGTELLIMNYQLENKKEKTKNIEHGFWS